MNVSIYNNKKILITGHTGFKGSWLSIWLKELGADVIGFSLDPYTENDIFNRTKLHNKMVDHRLDVRDYDSLYNIVEKHKPDFIFHLAAQPIVRYSYENPIETYMSNSIGTLNLLEVIRNLKNIRGAIFITTDKVYKNVETLWGYREKDPLGGYDPYSASKACAEIIIESYRDSFFKKINSKDHRNLPLISSVRAGNVIGGGDWQQDRLVSDCIRSLMKNEQIKIRSPSSTRPWQHVLDALSGYLYLGSKLLGDSGNNFTEAWNFGPNFESVISVSNLVENVIKYWGKGNWIDVSNKSDKKHEAKLLSLDITKSISRLGWHPVLSLDECLQFTVDWYKYGFKNLTIDMYDYTKQQIHDFCEIAKIKENFWIKNIAI